MERSDLARCERIVVKVGTSTLTHPTHQLNLMRMEVLVREMADIHNQGKELLLVSSGAIGLGVARLGLKEPPRTLPMKQAMAAVGQGTLVHMYEKLFSEYSKTVAQVLLTKDDFNERLRYLNSRNTLLTLLGLGVIPIINENDTVVVDEIKFGDNDTLSALVAGAVDADLLVILSDIDGLYDDDPRQNPKARRLPEVYEITDEMEKKSHRRGTKLASGGMYTKLLAAKIVMAAGIPMVVAHGAEKNVLRRIIAGEPLGTLFVPKESRMQARKRWIAFGSACQGKVYIDNGAKEAVLHRGKSLLPSGITGVEGIFERGNVISLVDLEGHEFARGITNYSAEEIKLIAGKKTSQIERILGHKDYDEVIHRNNLTVYEA
ncbi:MAG TPA: glutamate 5-kinase [Syntrophothermus lipocalidus]|uniref:Glutamate 5-kinase n=1 Tax=Syntrophothermus lipocalidus (strain DSM 12680 / TGB-C1) TaxID=643648 RepID=D7CLA5_SYNLT|nr:glutamate 5-kinase [Syntrophothermus lipocalidus]ADI01490.1 glutamate 5-kinase [Syntrophothermus lipocalidus DSM 12680]HHV76793.1 glutamate 5-kinase [Syntrophothermus lipocalidus]